MNKKKPGLILYLLLFFLAESAVFAQIPVKKWRTHLSYDSIHEVTGSEEQIYAASQSGVLVFNKKYNNIETLDKTKGLNDVAVSSLAYSGKNQVLLIAYHNGNLDVLQNGKINNYPHLKEQAIYSNKTIKNIDFIGKQALLSCPFGIAVFDLKEGEFKETYTPGLKQGIVVNDVAHDGNYLYAATEQGLFYANPDAPGLYDPDTWNQITTFPEYNRRIEDVAVFNNQLLMNVKNSRGKNELYYLDESNNAHLLTEGKIRNVKTSEDHLFVCFPGKIIIYGKGWNSTRQVKDYPFGQASPTSLYIEANDNLWIGDARYGLVRDTKSVTESIVPNGPSTNKAFKMVNAGTIIYSIPGGYTRDFNKQHLTGAINTFSEEAWKTEKFQEFTDLSDILVDPNNSNHLYAGTWGQGMLEIRDGEIINQFMGANSKLEQYNQQGVRVHNLINDEQGNLWMVNFGTENPIKFLDGEGKWKAFEYETLKGKIPGGLISATNGYKWGFIHDSPNLFVIDDFDTPANIKDDKVLIVEPKDFNGTSFTDEIYDILEDQEGNLWIATDEGISVDFEPGNIFQRDIYQPSRIRITREGYTQYMLRDNYVTDMAADPANQIWFATKTAGVFVYNPDKQTVVDHFTSRNSPLLTDTIQTLTINKKGEVFISTSKGIVSYRSETSEGRKDFSETYAFPNPVPPDYSGIITITNLVEDVNVKITDISGNLVYETIANGGQATWNGKNFSGQRVSSGVYLIFLTNEDGSKTHVEKLLFIK